MKLPSRSSDRRANASRGQALVEFGIILPVLLLLLVLAIDFGRVFFGWVALNNASRIGADYAGQNPNGWKGSGQAGIQDEYLDLVEDHVSGCELDPVDDPEFTDVDGDGDAYNWGDQARVRITCDFAFVTPLVENILGDEIQIGAESIFPVRSGTFAGPAGPVAPGDGSDVCTQALIPSMVGDLLADARAAWEAAGFVPANLSAFPNVDTNLVTSQTVLAGSCVDAETPITLTTEEPSVCDPGDAPVPNLIALLVSDAKVAWAADFTGGFLPTNAVDTDVVLTQKTEPVADPAIGGCVTTAATVTVTWGPAPVDPCDVPNLAGDTFVDAKKEWTDAGFDTQLKRTGNGALVVLQDPGHPGTVSCSTPGTVEMGNP